MNPLSRDAIRKLAPGQKISARGITAERLADGDVLWTVQCRVDGVRIHRRIGRESEGVTRAQAAIFLEQKKTAAREARLQLPKGRKMTLGFSTAADNYLARLEESGGKDIGNKRRNLRLHLKPFFAEQPLTSISRFTVDRYKKQRREKEGAKPRTINHELCHLTHLLGRAVEWGWLPAKPCTVQFLPEDAGRITVLSHAEADALMAAAIADADPYLWLFVAFGLHTGMRHSEITRTKFSEVDFERCRLFVSRAKRGAREQPITTTLRDILRREQAMVADPQGWIFPTGRTRRSKSGHRAAMNHSFRRAVVAAGLDPALVSPHTMRHTAITNLVEDGADIATIMAISGHATSRMVLRYTHLRREHVDKAIAALDRAPNVPKTSPASRSGALVKFEKPG